MSKKVIGSINEKKKSLRSIEEHVCPNPKSTVWDILKKKVRTQESPVIRPSAINIPNVPNCLLE